MLYLLGSFGCVAIVEGWVGVVGARCASEVIDDETPSGGSAFIESISGLGEAEGGTITVLYS